MNSRPLAIIYRNAVAEAELSIPGDPWALVEWLDAKFCEPESAESKVRFAAALGLAG